MAVAQSSAAAGEETRYPMQSGLLGSWLPLLLWSSFPLWLGGRPAQFKGWYFLEITPSGSPGSLAARLAIREGNGFIRTTAGLTDHCPPRATWARRRGADDADGR